MSNEFRRALQQMRRRDPQTAEDGFHRLRELASEHVEDLITEFHTETEHGTRCWLLELIGDAKSELALPLLTAELHNDDESLRDWAIRGLLLLDTPEARRQVWQWHQNNPGHSPDRSPTGRRAP
ncbi:HEAT repeat domain-containing protein [Hamadaea sp. NPDC051192]|uniref:HEAT repeat domain-containing protein n=1 Tax=Hamadaea sp. NPDC051192 TaxID=3154940 RepID=UPI00341A4BF2